MNNITHPPIEVRMAADAMGTVAIYHADITQPLRIVHLTDTHILPERLDAIDEPLRSFTAWQYDELHRPNENLRKLVPLINGASPDLVLVGGDLVDYLHPEANAIVSGLARHLSFSVKYCRGNHEYPWQIPWEGHEFAFSEEPFENYSQAFGLCVHPETNWMDYSFVVSDVRFVVLDTCRGVLTTEQVDWIIGQMSDERPFLILTHVPFACPTLEPRARLVYEGCMLGYLHSDENYQRLLVELGRNSQFLGVLAGHCHFRSEDRLGNVWQFLTGPAAYGNCRLIELLPWSTPRIYSPTSLARLSVPDGRSKE